MTSPRIAKATLFAVGLLCAACATGRAVDLAKNDQLYADIAWATKAPGDRAVFLAPVVDARTPQVLPTQERGFPILYGDDQVWERPVAEMVGEVLQRQIRSSGLFTRVTDRAVPEGLVCKPSIVSFLAGSAESVSGSRSFAEVALRVQVFGPADAAGKRALLLEETYANRQVSDVALSPVSPYRLVGRALRASIGKTLLGLDGSNVGRSDVPLGEAAPAAPAAGGQ